MKHLEIPNVPDELYDRLAAIAKGRGRSVEQETVDILAKWLADEQAEAAIRAEARKNREELRQKGMSTNDAELKAATDWGRE